MVRVTRTSLAVSGKGSSRQAIELAEGQRAVAVRGDLDARYMARSVVAIIKAISCSRVTDLSRTVFLSKMQTTRTLILSGIGRPALDGRT
jgi:hypothetical protein